MVNRRGNMDRENELRLKIDGDTKEEEDGGGKWSFPLSKRSPAHCCQLTIIHAHADACRFAWSCFIGKRKGRGRQGKARQGRGRQGEGKRRKGKTGKKRE
jgi:hypothetical protein